MVDENDVINSKIKKAVTDSVGQINYSDEQPEIKNLINIYCAYSHKKPQEVVDIYQGKNYADFKKDLAQVVVEGITPIREKYNDLLKNKDYLKDIYKKGAQKAGYEANKMISKVYRKIGFIEHE